MKKMNMMPGAAGGGGGGGVLDMDGGEYGSHGGGGGGSSSSGQRNGEPGQVLYVGRFVRKLFDGKVGIHFNNDPLQ